MSKTTLGSQASTAILYEEDTTDNAAAQNPKPAGNNEDEEEEDEGAEEQIGVSSTKSPSMAVVKSKNTALIEQFLTHFVRYGSPYSEDYKRHRLPANVSTLGYTAIVLDYETDRVEPLYEDLQAILSDILSMKVRYKIVSVGMEEEKVGFFIVKVPPMSSEDRQLATLAGADHRETLFYTKTVPDIKEFVEKKRVDLNLSIPQCYYAHYDRTMEENPVSGIIENLARAESIIVLEDLRPQGFGKRHYVQPLSLAEVRTALREIARVHATSWVMGELSGQSLKKSWTFYYKPEYGAMLYEALLEDGLPRFEKHLRETVELNRDLTAAKILERLAAFRNRGLRNIIYRLLSPSKSPAPTCIVHMDFWCDNIFFRHAEMEMNSSAGDGGSTYFDRLVEGSSLEDGDGDTPLDCQITDWQMFSIGRPTHDVALLLYTGLDSKIRKDVTDSMLEFYFKVFQNTVEKFNLTIPFSLTHIYEEYRRSQLWAVLQVIASIDLALNDDSTRERLVDATLDLIHQNLL